MLELRIESAGAPSRLVQVTRLPFRIGRGRDCDLLLGGWRVAPVHAVIEASDVGYLLRAVCATKAVVVNGVALDDGRPLAADDRIRIARHGLLVARCSAIDAGISGGQRERAGPDRSPTFGEQHEAGKWPGAVSFDPAAASGASLPLPADASLEPRAAQLERRRALHQQLLQTIDLRRNDVRQLSAPQLRVQVRAVLQSIVDADPLLAGPARVSALIETVLDEAVGLGPLESLLADPDVTEIMVNGASDIFCERAGRIEHSEACFSSEQSVRAVIERIVAPVGRRIDESAPMVDARLPDGSRVNAVLPPLAIRGPSITIRKFNRRLLTPQDLLDAQTLDDAMMAFLEVCVRHRRSIAVSGGTGSGKTTLLNVLACLVPAQERIVTIEDAAELSLPHRNLVALEARPANAEGRGSVVIRDLVRNALRMRPDRIVVGECRGGEALDMLQAMNTGHDGSLTTLHANGVRDALARLETMALMAGIELPAQAIREQIAGAVNIIVHQARLSDGRRRIVEIAEVTGIEGARIQTQTLFRGRAAVGAAAAAGAPVRGAAASGGWRFERCGVVPRFYESLAADGLALDLSPFSPSSGLQPQRDHDIASH